MKSEEKAIIIDEALKLVQDAISKGVTKYRIANDTSINETTIGNYANEKTKPSFANAKILIDYFKSIKIIDNGETINIESNSANQPKKMSSFQEPSPFEYDYSVIDFFKDYYSYLNYKEIDKTLLNKQLTALTDEESAKIAGIMNLNYDDFMNGIEIVMNSAHTGKLVPVYNAKASAGKANIDMYGPRSSWINVGDLLKDSEASLYVYGNSMIPGYPPGSLIGIRPLNESFIEPGSVYVVETESNRYIKRLYYNKDKTTLICISDNHIKHTDGPMEGEYLYPPFEIPIPSVKLIYKVIGVIKRNSISLS